MISTFFSLEAAKRGLMAHMTAIDVTGQNIANANTEGYSRQQAVLTSLGPLGPMGGEGYEAVGRGVTVQVVQQIKDEYLEKEILKQSAVAGFWEQKEELLNRIETLLLEPTDQGVRSLADKFWQAVEDLSTYPDDPSYRTAAIQAGQAFVEGVKYVEDQLVFLQGNLNDQVREKIEEVNSKIESIAQMNGELRRFETQGVKLNDLRDQRDKLIKEVARSLDVVQSDSGDGVDGGRLMLDGRILVDGTTFNRLKYEDGLADSGFPELRFENDWKAFTTETSVASGSATPAAKEGTRVLKVERLATEMTVENPAITALLGPGDELSDIRGITAGTIVVNGVEILVDPTATTLRGFADLLNEAGAGVFAEVTDGGRFILHAKATGAGRTVALADGTSNVLSRLGMVAERTGRAEPPVVDPEASLNIGGWIRLNGKTITIQQGKNDSLARIAEELNSGAPELLATVVTDANGLKQLRIANRIDPYEPIEIEEDPTGNVLHRLGVVVAPGVKTVIAGPDAVEGVDARFTLNGYVHETAANTGIEVESGLTLNLYGPGSTEIHVDHLSATGEVYSLISSRDELIPKYQGMLFDYMKTLTDSFNRVHYEGFNAYGGTHLNFFTPMADSLGDASHDALLSLAVNPLLAKDSAYLATAGYDRDFFAATGALRAGGTGDNTTALALSALRHEALFPDGATLGDRYAQIFADLGIAAQTVQATSITQRQVMTNLDTRREQVSGVSLDEEMTNLIKFQHGYNASARIISTVDELLDVLVNQLGR